MAAAIQKPSLLELQRRRRDSIYRIAKEIVYWKKSRELDKALLPLALSTER